MPMQAPNAIPQLYNLNHNSTVAYTDTRVVNADGEVKLTHIPKVGSVTIVNIAGMVAGTNPYSLLPNQFYVQYNNEYDYIGADRKVKFHQSKAGFTVTINYIVAASPVDADVINPLIAFVNNFIVNHYTIDDLANPGHADVTWFNITDHPVRVTPDVDGFMTHEDKRKLDLIDASIRHIAKVMVDTDELKPTGDEIIEIVSSSTVKPIINRDGKLQFDLILPTSSGTTNTPSYVLTTDSRLSDARTPKTHQHGIMDITGLDLALASKASSEHAHKWSEMQGTMPSALTMGLVSTNDPRLSNARVPSPHSHVSGDISDLVMYLDDKANTIHDHKIADIIDVENLMIGNGIPTVAPTDIFEGNFVAWGLDAHADAGLNGHIWMGTAYINNRRVAFNDSVFFKALGPRMPVTTNASDNTAYPILRGVYTSTEVNISYQFRVVTPNLFVGKHDGLSIEWKRSDDINWHDPITTTAVDNEMEHGLTFRMNMGDTTVYNVGDSWVSQVSPGQTLYIDLEENGEIAWNFVQATLPAPTPKVTAMRIATVKSDGTNITSIVDNRTAKKLRGVIEVAAPAESSNSNQIATTAFVMSKLGVTPGATTTEPTLDEVTLTVDQNTLLVPVGTRFQDMKGYKFVAFIYNPVTAPVAYNIRINGLNTTADYKTTNVLPQVPGGGYIRVEGVCDGILGGPAMVQLTYAISDGTTGAFTLYTASQTARLENITFGSSEVNAFGTNSFIRGIELTKL